MNDLMYLIFVTAGVGYRDPLAGQGRRARYSSRKLGRPDNGRHRRS
tara:strand:- start:355 stop:492 length:138 start_codon:yes stop_codon:yes gene_type:complete